MPAVDTGAGLLILVAVASYLLGSVPFGIVVTRVMGLGDIRAVGSGNIGATNVLRTGSKVAALMTLLLDGGKGAAAVLLARWIAGGEAGQLAGICAFAGHLWPVFAHFKGGKGVATFLGVMLALHWPLGLAACAAWLAMAFAFRYSSLAALVAAALSPAFALALGVPRFVAICVGLAVLVFVRHRQNIERLRAGTEPRIGRGRAIEKD